MKAFRKQRDASKTNMKIKCMLNHHAAVLCAITLLGLSVSTTAAAGNELTSGEIKKVRHLSRALLQSRALEKKRIEAEVAPQRAQIKEMEDSLGDLIANELSALTKVSLTPVNTQATTAVFNAKSGVQGAAVAPTVPSTSPRTLSKIHVRKDNELLKKRRMNRLQASQAAIKEARLATERKLPSRFAFWIKKSARDHRNESIVRTAGDVEQVLGQMVVKGEIDLERLKVLQRKVSLNKPDIDVDDTAPTFQTRTRHRAQ